ncbi:MAG: NADH-quinone oxidoreductase subunit C [Thermaerobacter sp.]|jgi:NADH-quinone oxidoreductase subunit C|nr:NADH-quinone oxidoreductase subunit C [Thermaerobacter sp.]
MPEAQLLAELAAALPEGVREAHPEGEAWALVDRSCLLEACRHLKAAGMNFLADLTAVDYPERTPRFEVVYHLLAIPQGWRLRLKVPVEEASAEVDSVATVWKAAPWAEREVFDLFGIRFAGHPDLKRILLPDEWEDHPLRKDFPLTGKKPAEEASRG